MFSIDNSEESVGREDIVQVVTFVIGEEQFAFDIFKVQEIIRITEITRVPKSPEFIEGVINLRGNVLPIIDLRKRFGLEPRSYERKTRIVVVEMAAAIVGFIVDAVLETRKLASSCIEPPPSIVISGVDSEYITGVAKLEDRLLILLDIDKILYPREQKALEED